MPEEIDKNKDTDPLDRSLWISLWSCMSPRPSLPHFSVVQPSLHDGAHSSVGRVLCARAQMVPMYLHAVTISGALDK